VHCDTDSPASLSAGAALAKLSGLKTFEVVVDLTLSHESLASLKTLSSTSAHNGSGKSQTSVHVGVDFGRAWYLRGSLDSGPPPQDSGTIDSIRAGQRGLERTLLERPGQRRLQRVAEEQARKEKQVVVRSTRGLRNLEKK
jgi:hypothetical protein